MYKTKCSRCGCEVTADKLYCPQCGAENVVVDISIPYDKLSDEVTLSLNMLDNMVGIESVKKELHDIVEFVKMDSIRTRMMGYPSRFPRKYMFVGNPSTGRTTVARLLASILHGLGVLPKDKMITAWSRSLVAGDVEKCRAKVRNTFDSARGGVLFIDDIHLLDNVNDNAVAATIDELMRQLPLYDDMLCIVSGTPSEMKHLCEVYPTLRSYFDRELIFER